MGSKLRVGSASDGKGGATDPPSMGHVERTANGLAVIDAQCQTLLLPVDRLTGCLITMRDSCADETDPRKEAQLVDLEFHETRSPINPRRLALIGRRRQVAPRSIQAAK